VSDCIIYILYLILYFSLYSTQRGCLTWKKNIYMYIFSLLVAAVLKKSPTHVRCEVQAAVLMEIRVLWGKHGAVLLLRGPDHPSTQCHVLIFSYTFLTGQQEIQILSPSCSWSIYVDIGVYSASVNAFTMLVWWMHVYKFAAVTTNAQ
jgi:hypothetical protein